ncbi:MAG: triose-phosphate isomerase [Candidatus Woesearchaeota archaeon]
MKLTFPVVVVNLKNYKESTNNQARKIAKSFADTKAIICVNALDLKECKKINKNCFAQHVDAVTYGGQTGHILPEVLQQMKVTGTLLNHSEKRIPFENIKKAITLCKEHNIYTIVCTQTAAESAKIAKLGPDCIAIEPPELIGGDISVTSADPKIVSNTVKKVHAVNPNIPVLCGAGVKNKDDVSKALDLGAKGVLVASGVVKAKSPKKAVLDLLAGLKK